MMNDELLIMNDSFTVSPAGGIIRAYAPRWRGLGGGFMRNFLQ
jgi:hypothetical protein